ncbi:MAG: hypothetical protein WB621_15140, partial [Candidatus Acidiferrales bacterium]
MNATDSNSAVGQTNAPLNILVVHEMLPHPDRHGADVQWMQMLRELRAQGHEVVHVARSGVNRERYAAGVEELGIKVLALEPQRFLCSLRSRGVGRPPASSVYGSRPRSAR